MILILTGRMGKLNKRGIYVRKETHIDIHKKLPLIPYTGKIWCPRTKYGTWVMRHNGAIIPSGNTFTSKNLPMQLRTAVTEPGKFSWVSRLYNGAWGGVNSEEIAPEDLPKWLEKDLGLPLRKVVDQDGVETFMVATPRGWLPQTELNEMADLLRGGDFGKAALQRVNPIFKEALEQAFDVDSYTGRQISEQGYLDVMGVILPARVAHLVRNVRLVGEIDKQNPGGIFTELGKWMGWWESGRPHRREALGEERAMKALVGWSTYGVQAAGEQERKVREAIRGAREAEQNVRWARRRGQTAEAARQLRLREGMLALAREAQGRLSVLRRSQAAKGTRTNTD
jgi:hypothetical protein